MHVIPWKLTVTGNLPFSLLVLEMSKKSTQYSKKKNAGICFAQGLQENWKKGLDETILGQKRYQWQPVKGRIITSRRGGRWLMERTAVPSGPNASFQPYPSHHPKLTYLRSAANLAIRWIRPKEKIVSYCTSLRFFRYTQFILFDSTPQTLVEKVIHHQT